MKIFLSYRIKEDNNEDVVLIDNIKKRINTIGNTTLFIDDGNKKWDIIEQAIKSSNAYIVILSKGVVEVYKKKLEQKDKFIRQIELAKKLQKNIFPIRFPSYTITSDIIVPNELNFILDKMLFVPDNDLISWFDSQVLDVITGKKIVEENVKLKLKIKSNVDCIVKLNGEEVGSINVKDEVPFVLKLSRDEYDLTFITKNTDDVAELTDTYKKVEDSDDEWAIQLETPIELNQKGYDYYYGLGVEKDRKKAVYWYKQAAEQGLANAQYNLGICYDNGQGVAQDYNQAVYWYKKAAEQGDADAKAALQKIDETPEEQLQKGWNYYYGINGVKRNRKKGLRYYKQAAEGGNINAKNKLKKIRDEKIKRNIRKFKITLLIMSIIAIIFGAVECINNYNKRKSSNIIQLQHAKLQKPKKIDYSKIKIGDYFYSDCSFSHKKENKLNAKCIGVVFSLQTTEEEKKHGWTHGQILALEDVKVTNYNHFDWDLCRKDMHIARKNKAFNFKIHDKKGYNNTNVYMKLLNTNTKNGLFSNINLVKFKNIDKDKTSGWYLPSIGQWVDLVNNLGGVSMKDNEYRCSKKVTNLLAQKYGLFNIYWSSTKSDIGTWYIQFKDKYNDYALIWLQYGSYKLDTKLRLVAAF